MCIERGEVYTWNTLLEYINSLDILSLDRHIHAVQWNNVPIAAIYNIHHVDKNNEMADQRLAQIPLSSTAPPLYLQPPHYLYSCTYT